MADQEAILDALLADKTISKKFREQLARHATTAVPRVLQNYFKQADSGGMSKFEKQLSKQADEIIAHELQKLVASKAFKQQVFDEVQKQVGELGSWAAAQVIRRITRTTDVDY